MKTFIIFACMLLLLITIEAKDKRKETTRERLTRLAKKTCKEGNVDFRLNFMTFDSTRAVVETETEVIEQVELVQKEGTGESAVEIRVNREHQGYTRYAYNNGTRTSTKLIKDGGHVPLIVNGKVTKHYKPETGGLLFATKPHKTKLDATFTCKSVSKNVAFKESGIKSDTVSCKVYMKTVRYLVPFVAYLYPPRGSFVCVTHGTWERYTDASLQLVTELVKPSNQ